MVGQNAAKLHCTVNKRDDSRETTSFKWIPWKVIMNEEIFQRQCSDHSVASRVSLARIFLFQFESAMADSTNSDFAHFSLINSAHHSSWFSFLQKSMKKPFGFWFSVSVSRFEKEKRIIWHLSVHKSSSALTISTENGLLLSSLLTALSEITL